MQLRHPATIESFSRAQSNEWYVASRHSRPGGNQGVGGWDAATEVFMKVERKDASLVDVDQELGVAIREAE
jgi:hypothetical protein